MNLRQLECFIEVSHTLNFTQAAKNLYISQTAVTNQIKRLEDSTGLTLFDRNKKNVVLTESGSLFLGEAQKAIQAFQACESLAEQIRAGSAGSLRIGYIRGIEKSLLIPLAGRFYQENPGIRLSFLRGSRLYVENLLKQNEADCIFTFHKDLGGGYEALPLARYTFCAAVSRSHPLAKKSPISYQMLLEESNVEYDALYRQMQTFDLDNILLKIAANICTAVVPSFIADYTSYQEDIRFLPLPDISDSFRLFAVYRKSNPNKALKRFLKELPVQSERVIL